MKKIEIIPLEMELRDVGSIINAENEFCDKVWYNRCHLRMRAEIEDGELSLVQKSKPGSSNKNVILKADWEKCLKSGKRVEKKYGKKKLGPYSDFDWGMINGKLSAIRWVLGDDWDQLDT